MECLHVTSRQRLLLSAFVAAIVFGIGFAIAVTIPGLGGSKAQDVTDYYNNDTQMNIAFLLFWAFVLGSLAMVWFFNELNARLESGILTRVAFSAAMLGIVASIAGASVMAGPTMSLDAGASGAKFVGVDAALAFSQGGAALMLGMGFAAFALSALLYTMAASRQGAVTKPFYIACYVLFVISLASFFWIPGYAFILWVAVMGIGLYVGEGATAAPRVPTAERAPA